MSPFDRRLIRADRLSPDERDWLNAYHAEVLARLSPPPVRDGHGSGCKPPAPRI
jgi:hypothetical protein